MDIMQALRKISGKYALGMILSIVIIISVMALTSAQTYTNLIITVKDINTDTIITSFPVDITFIKIDTGTTINLTKRLGSLGSFDYKISPGNWKIRLFIDNTSTPESDYSAENVFSIDEGSKEHIETVYLSPIGAVDVKTNDKSNKPMTGIKLKIKCGPYEASGQTDTFGSYKFTNVPVDKCKVYAADDYFGSSATVSVMQGQSASADIIIQKGIFSGQFFIYLSISLGIIILVGGFMYFFAYYRPRKKVQPKEPQKKASLKKSASKSKKTKGAAKEEETSIEFKTEVLTSSGEKIQEVGGELNPRARDIMATLNEREKKIVDFIIEQGNKSTQAAIRNGTGIPKTSLARAFQSLESKKVVIVDTVGRLKKVELTGWFLGRE